MNIYIADTKDSLRKIAVKYRIDLENLVSNNAQNPVSDFAISDRNVYLLPNMFLTDTIL
jgi:hypothetical protein